MKLKQYFLGTCKGQYKDADIISHQLMLRAGLIRKVSSGLYMWLPTGLRVLRKLETVIRNEMNKIGALEVYLPIVQPAKLWKKSSRWTQYGPELLRFRNRHNQDFILSPTHEELIAEIIGNENISYQEFPLIFYQIQNKFRDEMRPRFGMFRSYEFIMKDAYSFHTNYTSLQNIYKVMYKTYNAIFNKLKLNFRVIQADSGNIGGDISHEFHAIVDRGEDKIVCSTLSNYTASMDLAESVFPPLLNIKSEPFRIKEKIRLVKVYHVKKITDICLKYNVPKEKFIQVFIVRANKNFKFSFLALLIRSDHELNYSKVERLPQIHCPLSFASKDEICSLVGIRSLLTLGPVNLPIPLIADRDVAVMNNFISGANIDNGYFFGINWGRDLPCPIIADLRKIVSGDCSPDGNGVLKIKNSIEIGHIFQLGSKYFHSSFNIEEKSKKNKSLIMGCYGIGVSRIIAAIIEQNNDEHGIKWPELLAPFFLVIIPINMYRSCSVNKIAKKIYDQFSILNIDILLDDRNKSVGVKFADMELIGIPHCLIISEKNLNTDEVEYKNRNTGVKKKVKLDKILDFFSSILSL